MTLLSKIGAEILKGIAIVSGLIPVAEMASPSNAGVIQVVSQDLTQVANIITSVEAAGQAVNLPGPQKLQMAAPQVAQVILQSAMLVNHKISNPALFTQGSTKIADGMADVLNSLNPDGITITNKS